MLNRLPDSRWNYDAAAHLLNRAGFSGPPAEIQKLADAGLSTAVARLVEYEKIPDPTPAPDWAKPDPNFLEYQRQMRMATEEERREMQRARRLEYSRRSIELRQWWLQRMTSGPRPLQEKMTLFWHGHFATSIEKVDDPYLMWLQNDTFRRNAVGSWETMLMAVSKDPAMLIWLDNTRSNKNKPNENYAREVMELFSLGEGHYSEDDIKEAARALTGWGVSPDRQSFRENPKNHDPGTKVFLGLRGQLTGEDVVRQILRQPQANLFITAKLWNFFAGEYPGKELNQALADEFANAKQQFAPLLTVLFSSEEFYSPRIRRNQVKGPVQWLVSSVRLLERDLPPAILSNNMLRALGQDLFRPPNVKGWDGGIAWINTSSLLNRYNYSASLVDGNAPAINLDGKGAQMMERAAERAGDRMATANVAALVPADVLGNPHKLVDDLLKRFIQAPLKPQRTQALRDYLQSVAAVDEPTLRHAVRLLMSTPDYQLT